MSFLLKNGFRVIVVCVIVTVIVLTATSFTRAQKYEIGVKPGDYWVYSIVEYDDYDWIRIEVKSISGTYVTLRSTIHRTDGTEHTGRFHVDLVGGSGAYDPTFGGLLPGGQPPVIINSNLNAGDNITQAGVNMVVLSEEERTYAGAKRRVLYVMLVFVTGEDYMYYDKETGILCEHELGA